MNWGAEIFYGVCTATAFGLSWKQGGSIAIAGALISAMWLFQGLIYWSGLTFEGNMMGSMISALLLLLICRLKANMALCVVMACLASQLYMHVTFRMHGPYVVPFYIAINVLYVVQLIALGWSGGRIVLDKLGGWMADLWFGWRVMGMAWVQKTCSRIGFIFSATAGYYLGGIYVRSNRDLWRA